MQTQHRNVSWLRGRELGMPPRLGHQDGLSHMLYSSVNVVDFWDPVASQENHRGIFNFDFSTDGAVMVAACEGRSFLVFDANNHRLIRTRRRAHTDCVNCVRFLDTRTFVTCSDDTTVVLWDLRFLKSGVRVFSGHTSWVKNIEYASSLGLLITSGFDGSVYSWNINNYSKEEERKRLFQMEGLMRCKLTPDESKMVVSTSRGYLLVVHDLHLPSLSINVDGYKAEGLWGSRLRNTVSSFYSLFQRPCNRLEVVNDFPARNDAENIASLQVHPQGWCIVSRNTSKNDATEWTCVHDIHSRPYGWGATEEERLWGEDVRGESEGVGEGAEEGSSQEPSAPTSSARTRPSSSMLGRWRVQQVESHVLSFQDTPPAGPSHAQPPNGTGRNPTSRPHTPFFPRALTPAMFASGAGYSSAEEEDGGGGGDHDDDDDDVADGDDEDSSDPSSSDSDFGDVDGAAGNSVDGEGHSGGSQQRPDMDLYGFFVHNQWNDLNRSLRIDDFLNRLSGMTRMDSRHRSVGGGGGGSPGSAQSHRNPAHRRELVRMMRNLNQTRSDRLNTMPWHNFPPGLQSYLHTYFNRLGAFGNSYHSHPRLIYSQQEPNVGRGFIKEQCFSADGRLIVSPCGNGVRMLAFDERCRELCDCQPAAEPGTLRSLHQVRELRMHPHVVLTTRFSPTHNLFVSGSLDGSIAFMAPTP